MSKRKHEQDRAVRASEDIASLARAAARSIVDRLETDYPAVNDLADDEEFVRTSRRLADPEVDTEIVERLARSSSPIVAAMANRALARRSTVSEEWRVWAMRRLKHAYAGELCFILEAIERHVEPPLLARVLAHADDDWSWGWCLDVISQFVERRVRAGEAPGAADFDAVTPSSEEVVAKLVGELEGVLPATSVRAFDEWRRRRDEVGFFRGFARIWEPVEEPPVLTSVGGRAAVVAALRSALHQDGSSSLLLVGEHGVGKSAVLRDVLAELHAEGWFIFEANATELMAGQSYIGQIDGRLREIAERTAGKRVLWVMPAFADAISAGQHTRSREGVLDRIFPYVEAGQLRIIGELEPRAYDLVMQQRPRTASLFETLRLPPLTTEETLLAARDWRDRTGVDADDETIEDALDLAEHYLAAVAAPGNVLRLLKATTARVRDEHREQLRTGDVLATLSEATGLPLHVVDAQAPLDLVTVRDYFASRIIGQPDAVECVVDRIALIKAGLTDPTRPLGVFLFVGPTGTGKTELAKTLAEFLFGSPDRLVRLDMSEFQTPDSLDRLLADPTGGEKGASLISAVRSNPFSVVLLDEFEKAHRNIWNVFLQLFDDGRLTDHRGRTADFRQCVVILTSNLGAAVGRATRLGFTPDSGPKFTPAAVERVVSQVFRPELLNRIDRVVVFRPFEREQMRALLDRELAQVLDRRGLRARPWAVEWDEVALEFLAEKGFSPELGARPLKRAVERYLLAPLANAIVSRSFAEGEQFLFITARNDRIEVAFVDPDAEDVVPDATPASEARRLEQLVLEPHGGAADVAFLQAETERLRTVIDGAEWGARKERDLEVMQSEEFWSSPERFVVLARVEYVDRVQAAFRTAEKLLARLLRQSQNGRSSARRIVELLAERLYLLDRACTGTTAADPADAFVEVRAIGAGAEEQFARQLREMYESWGLRRGMQVTSLASAGADVLGISGIGAYQILAPETGVHVFESPRDGRSFDRIVVHVAVAPALAASPGSDAGDLARAALRALSPSTTVVRRYRTGPAPLVRDTVRDWRTGRLDRVLAGEFDVMAER
jgi:ATP-dependent Clp protease ATP-binding subunit ClpC